MPTKIEWTRSDDGVLGETWNPIVGCSKVSAGCRECYAIREAHRLAGNPNPKISTLYAGLTTTGGKGWTGMVRIAEDRLAIPLHWRKPRRIFVNSMSDLFHEAIPEEFIGQVFATMSACPQHVFQILTKRPKEMVELIGNAEDRWGPFEESDSILPRPKYWPLPNVWLGVSVEDQASADERIPLLLKTPAAVRWVSYEPAVGPLKLRDLHDARGDGLTRTLDWVVAGGESGPHARPSHPDWFRSVRDQCQAAGVPFFFKQWGEYAPEFPQYPHEYGSDDDTSICSGRDFPFEGVLYRSGYFYNGIDHQPHVGEGAYWVERVGKKSASRLLDGREWNEYPR